MAILQDNFIGKIIAKIKEALAGKQDILVSGTNLKTINNQSLLGEGNISLELGGKMNISGNINLAASTADDFKNIFDSMSEDEVRMYLVTDSSGTVTSSDEVVTVTYDDENSPAYLYFGKDYSFGVSVGDICSFIKRADSLVCKIISLSSAKASTDEKPGADGLLSAEGKEKLDLFEYSKEENSLDCDAKISPIGVEVSNSSETFESNLQLTKSESTENLCLDITSEDSSMISMLGSTIVGNANMSPDSITAGKSFSMTDLGIKGDIDIRADITPVLDPTTGEISSTISTSVNLDAGDDGVTEVLSAISSDSNGPRLILKDFRESLNIRHSTLIEAGGYNNGEDVGINILNETADSSIKFNIIDTNPSIRLRNAGEDKVLINSNGISLLGATEITAPKFRKPDGYGHNVLLDDGEVIPITSLTNASYIDVVFNIESSDFDINNSNQILLWDSSNIPNDSCLDRIMIDGGTFVPGGTYGIYYDFTIGKHTARYFYKNERIFGLTRWFSGLPITEIDFSNFDFSNVQDNGYWTLSNCPKLEKVVFNNNSASVGKISFYDFLTDSKDGGTLYYNTAVMESTFAQSLISSNSTWKAVPIIDNIASETLSGLMSVEDKKKLNGLPDKYCTIEAVYIPYVEEDEDTGEPIIYSTYLLGNIPQSLVGIEIDGIDTDLNSLVKEEVDGYSTYTYQFEDTNSHIVKYTFETEKLVNCCHLFGKSRDLCAIDLSNFDTRNVTNMSSMFAYCGLPDTPDLSHLNTANVTDVSYMFAGCRITSWPNIDTSSASVTTFEGFFSDAYFDNNDDVINVPERFVIGHSAVNLSLMFEYTGSASDSLVFSNLRIKSSHIKDLSYMFASCGLSKVTIESILKGFEEDLAGVTSMAGMFFECGFESLELPEVFSRIDGNSEGVDVSYMFSWNYQLSSLTGSSLDWEVSSIEEMFDGCESLENLGDIWIEYSRVRSFREMFEGCESLSSIDLSMFWIQGNSDALVDVSCMFNGCTSLSSIDMSYLFLDRVEDMSEMFKGCTSLESVTGLYSTDSLKTTSEMFYECKNLTDVDLSYLILDNVESTSYMFGWCESLTKLDINLSSKCRYYCTSMFQHCTSLESVNLKIERPWNIERMFEECTNLKSLYLTIEDSSQLWETYNMFRNITTNGTLYHNDNSDFSMIISELPSTWTVSTFKIPTLFMPEDQDKLNELSNKLGDLDDKLDDLGDLDDTLGIAMTGNYIDVILNIEESDIDPNYGVVLCSEYVAKDYLAGIVVDNVDFISPTSITEITESDGLVKFGICYNFTTGKHTARYIFKKEIDNMSNWFYSMPITEIDFSNLKFSSDVVVYAGGTLSNCPKLEKIVFNNSNLANKLGFDTRGGFIDSAKDGGTLYYSTAVMTSTTVDYLIGSASNSNISSWKAVPIDNVASETHSGYMSVEDKIRLDSCLMITPVVSPDIDITWSYFLNDGTTATTPEVNDGTDSSPIIEIGYKAKYSASFSWSRTTGKKDPTSTSGDLGTVLPTAWKSSDTVTVDNISSTTKVSQTLSAPSSPGFVVDSNGNVKYDSSDTVSSTASRQITFKYRLYYGLTNEKTITEDVIKDDLTNTSLVSSRSSNLKVTAAEGEYFCYAYPAALGELSSIVQNSSIPALGAFTKTTVSITNVAGLTLDYYVYRSNNDGAFTNATLEIK